MMKMISDCGRPLQSGIKNWHTAMTRSSEAEEKIPSAVILLLMKSLMLPAKHQMTDGDGEAFSS